MCVAPRRLASHVLQRCHFSVQTRTDRGAAVQLVRRVGVGPQPGPATAREECSAPLAATADCCLKFIADHTRGVEAVSGPRREILPEYPQAVLREAIVNALAHRDYNLKGSTVDISVWDDRVEVHSPGPLPGHITLENMRTEHYSRNPRIMRVLKTVGLVEEYGEGVERMYREMESRLLEPPVFSANDRLRSRSTTAVWSTWRSSSGCRLSKACTRQQMNVACWLKSAVPAVPSLHAKSVKRCRERTHKNCLHVPGRKACWPALVRVGAPATPLPISSSTRVGVRAHRRAGAA